MLRQNFCLFCHSLDLWGFCKMQVVTLSHAEAANVEKIVTHFMRGGITPSQIGVITPYEGQRAHILATMQRSGSLNTTLYTEVCTNIYPCAPHAAMLCHGLQRCLESHEKVLIYSCTIEIYALDIDSKG